MQLPAIGETVTPSRGRDLCLHFGYTELADRIDHDPGAFKAFVFDGASMIPDRFVSQVAKIPHLTEIALRHDLKYAYGEPGNKEERERADAAFKKEVLEDGAAPFVAEAMYQAVRLFGDPPPPFRTSFSWGFARVNH